MIAFFGGDGKNGVPGQVPQEWKLWQGQNYVHSINRLNWRMGRQRGVRRFGEATEFARRGASAAA